jgi:glycosyltransferase involved in cell wall biosynthesis
MRVLQVAPPWFCVPPTGYGGIEWVVASLADGLADAGHEVTLLASGGSRTRARLRQVFTDPPSPRLGDPWVEAEHVLAAYADPSGFDLIHDHSGPVGLAAAAAAASSGPPVVHTLHGPWTRTNSGLYRRVCDRVRLVAISHDQAGRAPEGIRVADVVHNGIPIDRYPFREDRDPDPFLLFVGRASIEKGPVTAIEVAARTGLPLVMAIKVNEREERAYFDEAIAPAAARHDVEILTRVTHEEKVDLMGRATAVLFPIQWDEPFGLVMAEANACGTPVIAFARGAAPEVLRHEDTGYLVPSGDVDGLVDAVKRADAIERSACRRHVERHFSAAAMVERYLACYRRVLDTAR